MRKSKLANYLKNYDYKRDPILRFFGSSKEISQLKRILHKPEVRQLKDQDKLPQNIINEILVVIKNLVVTKGPTYQILAEIKLEIENEEVYKPQNKKVTFLIEGYTDDHTASKFPELNLTMQLAKANSCGMFDCISSFDEIHLGDVLKDADERKQKILILSVFLAFAEAGDPQKIIDEIIIPPFKHLVDKEIIKEIPQWVSNLNFLTIAIFAQNIFNTYYHDNYKLFAEEKKTLIGELYASSNQISQKQLVQHLAENPETTTVYGLIGSIHLVMLDSIGKIISKDEDYYYIQLNVNDRVVDIHLFGGTHGKTSHYEKMAKFVSQQGLSVPKLEPADPQIDINLLLSVLASQSKQSYMSESSFDHERSRSKLRKHQKGKPKSINELADQFDYWMKNYTHNGNKTHNQELLSWLTEDKGVEYIKNYNQFCDLASALFKKNYKTNPPPSLSEFNETMLKYKEHSEHPQFKY